MSATTKEGHQPRALIYNRVSSDPSGRRVSVESQDTENRAWCQREGVEVATSITDNDRSASRVASKEREGYSEVRAALAGQLHGRIDFLVVWESSRAQRDLADYVALRKLCVTFGVLFVYKGRVYDMTDGDDRFSTGIDALVDEREAERIRERALRGHRASAAKGEPRGTVPFGYRREYHPQTGRLVAQVPDPETAPVVREVVSRLLTGDTLYGLASDLNRRGVATPQSRKDAVPRLWSSATIRVLVASQSMIGIRTHNGEAHSEATWEPIVSAVDWSQARAALADPYRARHHRGVAVKYLLSGIATCGVCGAWLRPATNRGRAVYQCAGHGVGDPRGKGHVSRGPRERLDAMVTSAVTAVLSDPTFLERAARARSGDAARLSGVDLELADLQARKAEFKAAAEKLGGPAAEEALSIIASYSDQIKALRARMGVASGLPQAVLDAAGPDAAKNWADHGNDVAWQRQMVRFTVQVVVNRAVRGMRGFDPSSIEITPR